jgi:hypothetical protein
VDRLSAALDRRAVECRLTPDRARCARPWNGVARSSRVSLEVTAGEGHEHSSELFRWDQVHPGPAAHTDPSRALAELAAVGVQAAVVAPERELRRWFSWQR